MKTGMYDLIFAEEMILERCQALGTERISVSNAAGRILAQDITEGAASGEDDMETDPAGRMVIAGRGCMIRPALHGMLIGQGVRQVEVYRKPMVGFYYLEGENAAACSEIDVREKTNRYILGTALREFGCSTIYQGCVPKERAQMISTIKMASVLYDAVIICGGAEPEEFIRVRETLEKTGAEILIDHIDMQPGATVCVGFMDQVPVFGIAGNSDEILTAFYLIILPALKKISGRREEAHEKIMVELSRDFEEHNEVTRILLGHLMFADGIVRLRLRDGEPEDFYGHAQDVDACVVIPAGKGPLKKGTLLNAYRIRN